jgi:predicted ATPase
MRTDALRSAPPPRAGHFVRRVVFDAPDVPDSTAYPFDLPVVRALSAEGGFDLSPGVTAIVGENGSGKSTLMEAVAVAVGLNPEGGSRSFGFSTRSSESELGMYLRAVRTPGRERRSFFLRAEQVRAGSQFLVATHSPILLALPGTTILQVDDDGALRPVGYDECRTVSAMRGFLAAPQRALRHLLEED